MSADRRTFALNDSEAMLRQLLLELDDLRVRGEQPLYQRTEPTREWRSVSGERVHGL